MRMRFRTGLSTALGALLCLAAVVSPASAIHFAGPVDALTVTISVKDTWPPGPVVDLSASAGAEGQMLLQWTAPDGNGNVFASSVPVAGYMIRIATFSVSGVGGSTTTWWNEAMDVRSLPAPAISQAPPAPAFPGTTQYMLLNQLWPGVTYYAMMISSDEAGNFSGADLNSIPPAVQASTLVYDAAPPSPQNPKATALNSSSFRVTWSSVSVYDLDYYKIYYDSTPPYDFSHSTSTFIVAPATAEVFTGLSTGTYIIRVTAVDRGQPRYPGLALESITTSSVTVILQAIAHQPQEPYGVALTSGTGTASLRWMPVVRFADLTPFAVSSAPTVDEMAGYTVYRATAPVQAPWNDVADLSSATLTWTDLLSGPQYYYNVRSWNTTSRSAASIIRTPGTKAAYVPAPDNASYYEVNDVSDNVLQPIEGQPAVPDSAYLVIASSRPQDLGGLNGRVLKSLEFDSYMGGRLLSPNFAMNEPGILSMHYELSASSEVVPSSIPGVAATPQNMSVYWFNGTNWVQMYGTLDALSQTMTVRTKYFGRYELRSVERQNAFSFNMGGVSNRYLTPNGDGKNDNVLFTFNNPKNSPVTAKILDLRGRVVASGLPPGPVSNSLMWAVSPSIPGGVYIYQIQAEGQTYTGTLVIIK